MDFLNSHWIIQWSPLESKLIKEFQRDSIAPKNVIRFAKNDIQIGIGVNPSFEFHARSFECSTFQLPLMPFTSSERKRIVESSN